MRQLVRGRIVEVIRRWLSMCDGTLEHKGDFEFCKKNDPRRETVDHNDSYHSSKADFLIELPKRLIVAAALIALLIFTALCFFSALS